MLRATMSKIYRAIVVDDERLARNDLRLLLNSHKNIEVLVKATNGQDALDMIKELEPDLVFLDIQMPGMDGFDILEQISSDVRVIFVTAFDEFALPAFEVIALNYLLKPVSADRLQQSIERINDPAASSGVSSPLEEG